MSTNNELLRGVCDFVSYLHLKITISPPNAGLAAGDCRAQVTCNALRPSHLNGKPRNSNLAGGIAELLFLADCYYYKPALEPHK